MHVAAACYGNVRTRWRSHRVWMQAEFTGNGANFPMFSVKVAANLRTDFGTDHQRSSPSSWNAWKRINEMTCAATDPAAPPYSWPFFRPAREQCVPESRWNAYRGCVNLPTSG